MFKNRASNVLKYRKPMVPFGDSNHMTKIQKDPFILKTGILNYAI